MFVPGKYLLLLSELADSPNQLLHVGEIVTLVMFTSATVQLNLSRSEAPNPLFTWALNKTHDGCVHAPSIESE